MVMKVYKGKKMSMGRKPRPKQTEHYLTLQPNNRKEHLKRYFPFLQSPPDLQHLLPILTMIYMKRNMEMS